MTSPSSPVDIIEKAMEGVTPGPWENIGRRGENSQYMIKSDPYYVAEITAFQENEQATADYIAACYPDRMREVLALARKAELNEQLAVANGNRAKEEHSRAEAAERQAEAMKREMAEKDARIAALEETLKPFAAHETADGIDGPGSLLLIPDEHPLLFNGLGSDLHVTVTVGDVRRARALIGGGNAED